MFNVDVVQKYTQFCAAKNIPFKYEGSLSSYDETTLFCPAGMQQFKKDFKDASVSQVTKANIQPCLRLLDLDSIGDGTDFLYFNMIGLFSFRGMTVKQAVDFWMEFLTSSLGILPQWVTIHPDHPEWRELYQEYDLEVREDKECIWSDGELSGYCTEFYYNGVEIGNIVNICGDCIDVGFGLERLDNIVNGLDSDSDLNILSDTIKKILDSGYVPGNKQHGYVLRRLIRVFIKKGGTWDNPHVVAERTRQEEIQRRYLKLKDKHKDKSKEWWFDTHGIEIDLVE